MHESMLRFRLSIIGDSQIWVDKKFDELISIIPKEKINRVYRGRNEFSIILDNVIIIGFVWTDGRLGERFDRALVHNSINEDEFKSSLIRSKCGLRNFEFID